MSRTRTRRTRSNRASSTPVSHPDSSPPCSPRASRASCPKIASAKSSSPSLASSAGVNKRRSRRIADAVKWTGRVRYTYVVGESVSEGSDDEVEEVEVDEVNKRQELGEAVKEEDESSSSSEEFSAIIVVPAHEWVSSASTSRSGSILSITSVGGDAGMDSEIETEESSADLGSAVDSPIADSSNEVPIDKLFASPRRYSHPFPKPWESGKEPPVELVDELHRCVPWFSRRCNRKASPIVFVISGEQFEKEDVVEIMKEASRLGMISVDRAADGSGDFVCIVGSKEWFLNKL